MFIFIFIVRVRDIIIVMKRDRDSFIARHISRDIDILRETYIKT